MGKCCRISDNYRPQRSCGQGNVFTRVCHSVHRGVGVSASVHAGIPHPPQDSHSSGRYASYWNAFLFYLDFTARSSKVMFLHLSVSHSVHRGDGVCQGDPPHRDPPRTVTSVRILLECILVRGVFATGIILNTPSPHTEKYHENMECSCTDECVHWLV